MRAGSSCSTIAPKTRAGLTARLARERGLAFISPYDDPMVIAGQGTVACELLRDASNLNAVVVPVSGGQTASGWEREAGLVLQHRLGVDDPVAHPAVHPHDRDAPQGVVGAREIEEGEVGKGEEGDPVDHRLAVALGRTDDCAQNAGSRVNDW